MSQLISTLNRNSRFNPKMSPKKLTVAIVGAVLALSLTGCGSDSSSNNNSSSSNGSNNNGGNSNNGGNKPPINPADFSKTATWTVTNFSPDAISCYDFDAQVAGDCSDDKWDIKLENQERGIKLWSNSGDSGEGDGGVFGLMDWSDLAKYKNATQDPDTDRDIAMHYNADRSGGIFDQQPWFEYNLNGKHQLYPNNRVYLITSDTISSAVDSSVQQPIYAMQIINYYSDAGASGHLTVRWIDTALPNKVRTQTINASNNDNWVYFDLKTGKATTDEKGSWQVGFNRNSVILNGGDSGDSNVGGYLAATPAGYYTKPNKNNKSEPIVSQFITDGSIATEANLINTAEYAKPTSARDWITDRKGSDLNPAYTGNFPNLDFGWYTYNGATHQLNAKPIDNAQGALIRSAEGNSYARVRLDSINYPDTTTTTPSSWVFKLDIQPAK